MNRNTDTTQDAASEYLPQPNESSDNGNGNGHTKIFPLKREIDPITLAILEARRTALADTGQRSANALVVAGAGDFLAYRQLIVDVLRQISVPAMYPYRDYVEVGGLMTYAPELGDLALHLAMAVHQILRGEKPGTCGRSLPTTFPVCIGPHAGEPTNRAPMEYPASDGLGPRIRAWGHASQDSPSYPSPEVARSRKVKKMQKPQ